MRTKRWTELGLMAAAGLLLAVGIAAWADAPAIRTDADVVAGPPPAEVKDPTPLIPPPGTKPAFPKATGGPDAFGYYWQDNQGGGPTYQWIDITATGTNIPFLDDTRHGPYPFGFSMSFYGVGYTNFWASSNGWLYFGNTDPGTSGLTNSCPLPSTSTPTNVVGGIWDDLDNDTGVPNGTGYYQNYAAGTCPYGGYAGACTVVEWYHMYHYGSSPADDMTFEILLFDNGRILIQIQDPSNEAGSGSTTGIENNGGTIGLAYACNIAASLAANRAILFYVAGVQLTTPDPTQTGTAGATVTYPFTLTNNTGATATFNMTYLGNVWPTSGPATVGPVSNGATANFNVTVTIPSTVGECEQDTATVTATSQTNPSDTASQAITTNSPDASVTIYDNGPIVTHPGGGSGGADASALQTSLGMNDYGMGNQLANGYRVADDFTVPAGPGWTVDQVVFYEYQSYSGATPTINAVNYQIWNGPPNGGGTVVFGDTTTNRLLSAEMANVYRVLDTGLTNADRPIQALTCSGFTLPAGTYWIDWQAGGTGSSGPWQPPISILGQTSTGNALQYTTAWAAVTDSGTLTPQGFPFTFLQCQAGGGGPTYDMNFRDQYNRSELCLDSTTGDYIYNVLAGAHAGDSFTGTATITPYGTTMFLFGSPCGGGATHCVSGSWNTTRHTASAILKSFAPARYSQGLSDANYTDSPACGVK